MVTLGSGAPGEVVTVRDYSGYTATALKGYVLFPGIFTRGPMGARLGGSWSDILATYGDIMDNYDSIYLVKRMMSLYGAKPIICRIAHYTDPADATSCTATCGAATLVDRAGAPGSTLGITAIGPGADSANLRWTVTDGTINPATEFNLVIEHDTDTHVATEVYKNASMDPAAANYILTLVNDVSVIATLADLGAGTDYTERRPAVGTGVLSAGDDGLTGLNAADWIGDEAAGTGFYAFDEFDEAMLIVAPESSLLSTTGPAAVQAGLQTYCNTHRKQLVFAIHTPPDGLIATDAADFRNGVGDWDHTPINDWCGAMYWGDLEVLDPRTGSKTVYINPAADVAGRIAKSHIQRKEWFEVAGPKLGNLDASVLGVRYNIGPECKEAYRDILANAQVNPIVKDSDGCYIDNFSTLQRTSTQLQNCSTAWLIMVMKKALLKYAKGYRAYKICPTTWQLMDAELRPWLTQLQLDLGFASFYLNVDANAPNIESGTINTTTTIEQGILMGDIAVKPIPSAKWVGFYLSITKLSMTFQDYEAISKV